MCYMTAVPQPLFTFGVIADVQWADDEDGWNYLRTVSRKYRGAFRTLGRAVDWWNELPKPPQFIAQLGDLIDGCNVNLGQSHSALDAALQELSRAPCPTYSLVGNHELYNFDRQTLAKASWLRHGDMEYYSFAPAKGWRVVVLDPYQRALIGFAQDDPRRQEAAELIGSKNPGVDLSGTGGEWFSQVDGYDRRFVPYNGGLGAEQLAWLRAELSAASAAEERVIIACHVILHPKACGGGTMAWDYPEALEVIASEEAGGCVAAVMCGHDHFGSHSRRPNPSAHKRMRTPFPTSPQMKGCARCLVQLTHARASRASCTHLAGQYHCDEETGVHHCTFCSPLNKGDDGDAFGLVHVWDDAIEVRGPCLDDFLPAERGGKPTGRPAKVACPPDSTSPACESVTLALRPAKGSGGGDEGEVVVR